ncbi:MAG: GntR family transcriptional regulator [Betaproteobacteria bacterium]
MTTLPHPDPALDACDRIAQVLEEDILFGRIAPGERLVEDPLMSRFDATRHAVRQALAKLERAGVAVREKNRGASVRRLERAEVERIYEVRELLVRQAVLRIPVPAPPALLAALRAMHEDHAGRRRERRWRELYEVNDRFHVTLLGGCGNDVLVDMIRHTMALSLPVRAGGSADPGHAERSEREHGLMLRLLEGSDRWALAQLCVDHLQPAKERYFDALAPHQR